MANIVVVGAQWGDEGKGKIVDLLTESADIVARYQGGHNAGHTVMIKKEQFILHVIPSGILHRGKMCIIGNGVVIHPASLIKEVEALRRRKVRIGRNLSISGRAHVIMPYHLLLDSKYEEAKGSARIGTTGRGIGPAYVDKMARNGIRMADLLNTKVFREKLRANLEEVNFLLEKKYRARRLTLQNVYSDYMRHAEYLAPFITDTTILINKYMEKGARVLFEGAQGTLLDIDHGTYPYVTSSNASVGGVCTGLGVSPTRIDGILGIMKAYTTRVGEGPFPSELKNGLGEELRRRGGEYGATTGRARRCGWIDAVSLRHAIRINGFTGMALTKLDVLDSFDTINVCVAYSCKGNDGKTRRVKEFPQTVQGIEECTPVFKEIDGWKSNTRGIKKLGTLPRKARAYIDYLEELLNITISLISTGKRRDEVIMINNPMTAVKKR